MNWGGFVKANLGAFVIVAAATVSADVTASLQRQIDEAAAGGGGRVVVPPGRHGIHQLFLKSNIELHLSAGAELVSLQTPAEATDTEKADSTWFLIGGEGLHNVSITGRGRINGNGCAFWKKAPGVDYACRSAWTCIRCQPRTASAVTSAGSTISSRRWRGLITSARTRRCVRFYWQACKAAGMSGLLSYYVNNVEDRADLRDRVERGGRYLSNPLKARMLAVMADDVEPTFCMQATGFGGLGVAEALKPMSTFDVYKVRK